MLCGNAAHAAPDEIQVYTEEINQPGQFGLEQHINYSLKGTQLADYPGQMPPHHVLQLNSEFSYGLSDTLEAGLYAPLAFTPAGYSYLNGLRARLKYIPARAAGETVFYGINLELGRESRRTADSLVGLEIRPIVGYRDAVWLASFNPILTLGLSAEVSHQPQFEPALKLSRKLGQGWYGGLEYYGSFGSPSHPLPSNQRAHSLYAAADISVAGWEVNCGIGRGFVNASDTWVMKAIVALPLQ